MGVLHSIPLCSRGNPRDTDQNNNEVLPTVSSSLATATTTQPLSLNTVQPQATSTPRPLSPDPLDGAGIQNENYDDSLASSGSNSAAERSDSGLDHSADELDRRQHFSLDDDEDDDELQEDDEGVFHEDPLMDETIPLDDEEGVDDPVERPPEPTVPDEAVPSDEEDPSSRSDPDPSRFVDAKDPTQRAISSLFSELMGDRPITQGGR